MRFCRAALVGLLAAGIILTGGAAEAAKPVYVWMFFVSGKPAKTFTSEETEKMQAAHLANLTRLFEGGKVLFAGPLGNAGNRRGTVLLKLNHVDELNECFRPDPYVQNHVMEVEGHVWLGDAGRLGPPKQPFVLTRATVAAIRKGPNWSEKDRFPNGVISSAPALAKAGKLSIWGSVAPGEELLATLLFKVESLDEVKAILAEDPAVRSGKVTLDLFRQLLADGTMDPPPPKTAPDFVRPYGS